MVGKVGSCRDVHSEVEAWHALERSEQRFRLAMESAPTGMAILELDAQFVEVNAELCPACSATSRTGCSDATCPRWSIPPTRSSAAGCATT